MPSDKQNKSGFFNYFFLNRWYLKPLCMGQWNANWNSSSRSEKTHKHSSSGMSYGQFLTEHTGTSAFSVNEVVFMGLCSNPLWPNPYGSLTVVVSLYLYCVCPHTLKIMCLHRAQASMAGSSEVRLSLVQAEGWASERVLSFSFAFFPLRLSLTFPSSFLLSLSSCSHHFPNFFLPLAFCLFLFPPPLCFSLQLFQTLSFTCIYPCIVPSSPSLPPPLTVEGWSEVTRSAPGQF